MTLEINIQRKICSYIFVQEKVDDLASKKQISSTTKRHKSDVWIKMWFVHPLTLTSITERIHIIFMS